ncbi:MAG: hypothetical protein ABI637_06750 [Gemmatimonadota bacterium]
MKEPQRALEVLSEGLRLHPDYIPASIVLGRCQLDLSDDAAAEAAFAHVIGLDTENVIALKALADITERAGRFGEAENWLRQLLVIDRSNDAARVQLARVDESRRTVAPAAVAESGAVELTGETSIIPETELPEPGARDGAWTQSEPAGDEHDAGISALEPDTEPSSDEVEVSEASELDAGSELDERSELDEASALDEGWALDEGSELDEASDLDAASELDAVAELEPEREVELQAEPEPEPAEFEVDAPPPELEPERSFNPALDPAVDVSREVAAAPLAGLETHEFAGSDDDPGVYVEGVDPDNAPLEPDAEVELRSLGANEFQLSSAADDLDSSSSTPGAAGHGYQPPDAAADLGGSYQFAESDDEVTHEHEHAAAAELMGSDVFEAPRDLEPELADASQSGWRSYESAPRVAADSIAADAEEADLSESLDAEPLAARAAEAWSPPAAAMTETAGDVDNASFVESDLVETDVGDSDLGDRHLGQSEAGARDTPAGYEPDVADSEPEPNLAEYEPFDALASDDAEPDLVVTESMAELYLRQGHHQEALTIYRELYLRNPEDTRLRDKVGELEVAEAQETPEPASREAAAAVPRSPSYAAAETGGTPVSALFRALLAARPAAVRPASSNGSAPHTARTSGATERATGGDAGGSGEPTRPADDRLSLSAVFGDDASPVPPASPAGAADDGISFDDFFDTPAAEPERRPAPRADDDLDQFHNWLQNLKR